MRKSDYIPNGIKLYGYSLPAEQIAGNEYKEKARISHQYFNKYDKAFRNYVEEKTTDVISTYV